MGAQSTNIKNSPCRAVVLADQSDAAGSAQAGWTLPVWLAAAARAALEVLRGDPESLQQPLALQPDGVPQLVPVLAAALLRPGVALAMARCDPGEGVLDLTRGLLLWVEAGWLAGPGEWLELEAGEGVGRLEATGEACLSTYARDLLARSLQPLLPPGRRLRLTLVIPAGRKLAQRTSNAAFGVVEGLALIGTQAEVQHSAAPDQLQAALAELRRRAGAADFGGDLVLVIGENGLDLAPRLGLPPELLLKAGNWIGPLLVAAAQAGVRRLLLFGYQGKLIKLAGGIFHTHHHLADGRAEVLTALAALEGLAGPELAALHAAPTVEQALGQLAQRDPALAQRLQVRIAASIEQRSALYLSRYGGTAMAVGVALFDRSRQLSGLGPLGGLLLAELMVPPSLARMPDGPSGLSVPASPCP